MKYIRTKDDVFELKPDKEQIVNGTHYHVTDDMHERDYWYKEEDVVKSADTIEELCDLFIIWTTKNICCLWSSCHNLPIEDIDKVYGAIWTDKGLIYVAKMNEKGELELL